MGIAEAIQKIASQGQTVSNKGIKVAKVISVAGNECVVELLDTEFEISGVRLQAESASGMLLIPAVDSFVIIAPIDDFEYVVVMFSELESIQFLDGSYGGLVKVTELVQKVNNLENKVNSIINTFNLHTHAGVTTGAGTSGPSATPISGTLTPTQVSDINNPLVTHGTV